MKEKRFTLTADHVTLLRNAYVSWWDCEFGAPGIDPKRPFGNGDVVGDVVKLLGWPIVETDDGIFPVKGTADRVEKLVRELETALAVVLRAGSFEPGEYVADDYHQNWRRAT